MLVVVMLVSLVAIAVPVVVVRIVVAMSVVVFLLTTAMFLVRVFAVVSLVLMVVIIRHVFGVLFVSFWMQRYVGILATELQRCYCWQTLVAAWRQNRMKRSLKRI